MKISEFLLFNGMKFFACLSAELTCLKGWKLFQDHLNLCITGNKQRPVEPLEAAFLLGFCLFNICILGILQILAVQKAFSLHKTAKEFLVLEGMQQKNHRVFLLHYRHKKRPFFLACLPSRTAAITLLYWWAGNGAIRAIYAAIPRLGFEQRITALTVIKPLTGISRHGFSLSMPALRARNI